MEALEVEVLSDAPNDTVIRMPGRRFPAIVVQGDSLHYMSALAGKIHSISRGLKSQELKDLSADLEMLLADKMAHYDQTLKFHKVESPY